ncbi:hypothetical protein M406DRAFT_71353 [Cryphonectria parasitica EP155]|uniref:Uncharacterized protein n=1 Tax=Cryphonectria parasitica (strain ATCC 38755 / EP155) TaxID=660469 RepID=A0A9P4XZW2_CRYP1|nr:uncharacterized protein M406DRAFT_71353 [Cryphonectria parasitica EP155]KAF3764083.1 hypothetical protein M406DRAFT_71353 [Cryphonectria parasitica EP155]
MYASYREFGIATAMAILAYARFSSAVAATFPDSSTATLVERAASTSTEWNTTLEIGKSKWHIGDAIASDFKKMFMEPACDATGCDAGSPGTFKYLTKSGGIAALGTATITLEGNADEDVAVIDNLLDAISTALNASSQCTTEKAVDECEDNASIDKVVSQWKRIGVPATTCGTRTFNDCYVVNYIQATMYDQDKNQKAQVTMSGESKDPQEGFDCSSFLGIISDALGLLGPLELTGVSIASGITSGLSAFCG